MSFTSSTTGITHSARPKAVAYCGRLSGVKPKAAAKTGTWQTRVEAAKETRPATISSVFGKAALIPVYPDYSAELKQNVIVRATKEPRAKDRI